VTIHELLHLDDDEAPVATMSGARIKPISSAVARAFLERLGETGGTTALLQRAWGAFEVGTALIGVGAFAAATPTRVHAHIAVAPERRRLHIGSDLLARLVDEAVAWGLTTLACTHPAESATPLWLVRSLRLTAARRVRHQVATMAIFVPSPATHSSRGDS
jgi:GNAT superfamily N-acetyltransferase